MKVVNISQEVKSIIQYMQLGDKFWMPAGQQFELVVRQTMFRPARVQIVTFESNGRQYRCNVWDDGSVFYLQEVE